MNYSARTDAPLRLVGPFSAVHEILVGVRSEGQDELLLIFTGSLDLALLALLARSMASLLHPVSTEAMTNEVEEVEDQFGDDGEETAAEDVDEEEEASDRSDSGLDETSSCNEDEEKYADQPGGGLSPRKVLKRAMATLQEDEDCGGGGAKRLQRVDTFSDFERTVDTGEDAPPVCGHAATGPPLHRVDTFGQSMTASAEAAARARSGAGRPLACPALARVNQNSSSTGVHGGLPLHRIPSAAGMLRALPEVEDAMRAVDGLSDLLNAPEPLLREEHYTHYPATEARSLPVVRQDTLDLLQHPSNGQVARTASRTASADEP